MSTQIDVKIRKIFSLKDEERFRKFAHLYFNSTQMRTWK